MPRTCAFLGLLVCACCAPEEPPAGLLANGSFEEGRAPWFDFRRPDKPYWGSFEISDDVASQGRHSLRLALDSESFPGATGIVGAAQDVETTALPRRLGGRYRVDLWERGTRAQYIQLVVMAIGSPSVPAFSDASVQLSLVLAGIDAPPFGIANRRFAFTGPLEPEVGRWISFEFDLHEEFGRHWGTVPVELDGVRLFAEARFDGLRRARDGHARALVYFDALELGE